MDLSTRRRRDGGGIDTGRGRGGGGRTGTDVADRLSRMQTLSTRGDAGEDEESDLLSTLLLFAGLRLFLTGMFITFVSANPLFVALFNLLLFAPAGVGYWRRVADDSQNGARSDARSTLTERFAGVVGDLGGAAPSRPTRGGRSGRRSRGSNRSRRSRSSARTRLAALLAPVAAVLAAVRAVPSRLAGLLGRSGRRGRRGSRGGRRSRRPRGGRSRTGRLRSALVGAVGRLRGSSNNSRRL